MNLLERAVGGPVFDRTPHGMRPTALGRALLDHVRAIVGDLDRANVRSTIWLKAAAAKSSGLSSRPNSETSVLRHFR